MWVQYKNYFSNFISNEYKFYFTTKINYELPIYLIIYDVKVFDKSFSDMIQALRKNRGQR